MGKRKIYIMTELAAPQVEHKQYRNKRVALTREVIPPEISKIEFGRNCTSWRSFDFARWYGVGIDSITYACQKQIERFQAGQDAEIQVSTLTSYCTGLSQFLDYLVLRATAFERELTLADINRPLIDDYIGFLGERRVKGNSNKVTYSKTKSVLKALGRRGLVKVVASGDAATFPNNPYPHSNKQAKGETPLPKDQRQAFSVAVKEAVVPIWQDNTPMTGALLSYALLIVALHTGRNTTPLLEMTRDCLRAHPKDGTTFLVLWKRRGHNTSKVILRADSTHERLVELTPTIKTNVKRLIERVLARTELLRASAPDDLKNRAWLYQSGGPCGRVQALDQNQLDRAICKLVVRYGLTDNNGLPLRINISRLRKTFANRIFELLNHDLATTAIALGNSPQVAARNYLEPNEEAKRNWRFMGEVLVEELLSGTIGATYHVTPMGHCSDPEKGQHAPKKEGATCINFLNCIRCRNYAVTGDDLHKLFSFYFRVLSERIRVDKRRWARDYAHIPRLIDNYILAEGIRRGTFNLKDVEAAREHARVDPHPFWSFDEIAGLEVFI